MMLVLFVTIVLVVIGLLSAALNRADARRPQPEPVRVYVSRSRRR